MRTAPNGAAPTRPLRPGDVIYDDRAYPAVVLAADYRARTVDVMLTRSADRGRRVEMHVDGIRLVTGYGAHQRCQWARDAVWAADPTALPPRPRTEVAAEAEATKRHGHTCADIDWCRPDADHHCSTTGAHLRALRTEWRRALR